MNFTASWKCAGLSLVLGLAAAAQAQQGDTAALRAEVEALRAELREMRNDQDASWIDERRSEEMRQLVNDVLQDADTRASLQGGGMTAGHDGKHFFLSSEDGRFHLEIAGQIQFRYIYNSREDVFVDDGFGNDTAAIKEDNSGFQLRRTKLNFSGHIGSPKFEYDITLAASRSDNSIGLEDATVGYKLMDNLNIVGGRKKLPFLREELTSSKRLLAVERSSVTEAFTLNRGEGIWVEFAPISCLKTVTSFSDGSNSGNIGGDSITGSNDFDDDRVDFAITSRADVKIVGDWGQWKDFSAWSDEPFGAFVGAAFHYEGNETASAATQVAQNYMAATVDGSVEVSGFNVYGAFMYGNVNPISGSTAHNYGFLVQTGYMVIPDKLEPFVRYEYMDLESRGAGDTSLIGGGVNYYFKKHAAKFTTDVVYAIDTLEGDAVRALQPFGANGRSSGLGLMGDADGGDGQFAVRAQFQLLF